MHINPRILRLLGLTTDSEWISAALIKSTFMPNLDKFLQTIWVYTSIIEPQIVNDTLAQVLRVIPAGGATSISHVFDAPIYCKLAHNHISMVDILLVP